MFTEQCVEYSQGSGTVTIDMNSAQVSEQSTASEESAAFGGAGRESDAVSSVELNWAAAREQAAAKGAERGPFLDASSVAAMGLEFMEKRDLVDLVVELAAERSRAEARFLAGLGELVSRDGTQSAAWQMREYTRMNFSQAHSEARLAEALAEHDLGDTLDALASGDIHTSHAKLVAREAPKHHALDEEGLLELCALYPSDMIDRRTRDYRRSQAAAEVQAQADSGELDPADAELAVQRMERGCSMVLGDDGMWHLRADLDFLAGRVVSMQLAAAARAVRQRDESADDSFAQRNADALCELISGRQRPAASLLIAADYDVASGRLADPRLDDGTPISAAQLAELAADAKILPAMFNSDWSQLALGRVRSASEAQRIILAIRDGGCIACATHSERCHAHHIDYYENGGNTDIPNLANLCEPCHIDHHQRHWPIETPPDGRPRRAPPNEQPRQAPPDGRPRQAAPDVQPRRAPPDGLTRPSGRSPTEPPGSDGTPQAEPATAA